MPTSLPDFPSITSMKYLKMYIPLPDTMQERYSWNHSNCLRYGNASTGRRTWNTLFPFPPYEVLETNEISVGELQTARRLSRLLDAFYNTPAWHTLTRELILNDKDFLHNFLKYLIQVNLIDQPMSLEKRGLILYEYCKLAYPEYKIQASIAWIEAGMSLKRLRQKSKNQTSDST